MVVFSYAVELDAADPKTDGYTDLLKEGAKAYRTRAACLQVRGDAEAAVRDLKRAEKLEAKLKNAGDKDKAEASKPSSGQVTMANYWQGPVTLLIGGVSYTLPAGEMKTFPAPAASFPYEMTSGVQRIQGTLEAGKTYSIGTPPAASK